MTGKSARTTTRSLSLGGAVATLPSNTPTSRWPTIPAGITAGRTLLVRGGKESTRPIAFTHSVPCQHVSQCNAVTRTEFRQGGTPLVLKSNKQNNKKRKKREDNKKGNRTDELCTSGVSKTWFKEHSAKNRMGYPGALCDTYIKESK